MSRSGVTKIRSSKSAGGGKDEEGEAGSKKTLRVDILLRRIADSRLGRDGQYQIGQSHSRFPCCRQEISKSDVVP